jgi:hypothetical protein
MSLTPEMRKTLTRALETVRDAGYGLAMTKDCILLDGLGVEDSVEYQRGTFDDGTFDELRALVAEVFQKPRRGRDA